MDCNEGLGSTKLLLQVIDAAIQAGNPAQLDLNDIRNAAKRLNKLLQTLARQKAFEKARATAEFDALRSEVHAELVDREANAARVAERQRFLFERHTAQMGQASAAERAAQSAALVEAALVSLCPHTTQQAAGCAQLAAETL